MRLVISIGSDRTRTARLSFAVLACLLVLVPAALAAQQERDPRPPRLQGDRRPPRPPREQVDRRAPVEAILERISRDLPEFSGERLEKLRRILHDLAQRNDLPEGRTWQRGPVRELVKDVMKRWESMRDRKDREFLATLDPQDAARLEQLDVPARRARINEMRLASQLEAAIANAMKHGLISSTEAEELRLADTREKIEGAQQLNRKVFLFSNGGEFSAEERQRLEALEVERFWSDPAVERFRLMGVIAPADLDSLRRLEGEQRRIVSDVLRQRRPATELDRVLEAPLAAQVRSLEIDDQARLARELEKVHWPRKRRFGVPRHVVESFDPDERRRFLSMSDDERLAYLEQKFPETDWQEARERWEASSKVDELLADVPPWERHELSRMSAEDVEAWLRRRFETRATQVDGLLAAMKKSGFFERPGILFPPPEWFRSLTPADRRRFKEASPWDKMRWLAERWPRPFADRWNSLPTMLGIEVPEGWEKMSLEEQFELMKAKERTPGEAWRAMERGREGREPRPPRRGENGRMPPPIRRLLDRLDEEQRRELEALPREEMMQKLRQLFPHEALPEPPLSRPRAR